MSFWQGRYVTVTGGKGFLGTHLCRELGEHGAFVIAHHSRVGDLRKRDDARVMYDYMPPRAEKKSIVFHLAARVSGIGAISKNPASSLHDNLIMGLNVLQAAADSHFGGMVVFAGSVCAYPKYTPQPMNERNLWEGYPEETNGPYGIAKRTLAVAAQTYRDQYGLDTRYPLLANLYGEGDDFNPETSHVIPALMRKMIEARERREPQVTVWGTGSASRDFLYVRDAVRALLMIAEKYESSEPINIGTGVEMPISGLASLLKEVTGYQGELVYDTSKPDGQPRRCLAIGKAQKELGWSATTSLRDGITATYNWYEPIILDELRQLRSEEERVEEEMKKWGFRA